MKKRMVKMVGLMLMATMSMSAFVGCAKSGETSVPSTDTTTTKTEEKKEESKTEDTAQKEVVLKVPTYMTGTNVAAPYFKQLIDGFNAENAGKIKVELEDIPSDQAYVDKMKILIQSSSLPDIIFAKNGLDSMIIDAGLAADFLPTLNADAEWKTSMGGDYVINNSPNFKDGKLYSVGEAKDVIGYFYNKEIFDEVGITPAQTWDEWMSNCEKIKAAGYDPIAFMTGENAWTTNLILSAIVGSLSDEGNAFMNTMYPTNYETPEMIKGLEMIQTMLKEYTSADAVGANYSIAANNFLSGKAAIIANGPWMIPEFSDPDKCEVGFDQKVGYTAFPGGLISAVRPGYVVASKGEAEREAAIKLVKYLTDDNAQQIGLDMLQLCPVSPNVEITDTFKQANPIFAEMIDSSRQVKYQYKHLDMITQPVISDAWQNLYPALVYDKMTPAEFAKELTALANK